jgi:serine/threonine protein kinase
MNPELTLIANRLTQATRPEEVFGKIAGSESEFEAALKQSYRALVKAVHPDRYLGLDEKLLAEKLFNLLNEWLEKAEAQIKAGLYGQPADVRQAKIALRTKKREYIVETGFTPVDLYNQYNCQYAEDGQTRQAVLKIARQPDYNDLAQNEARILRSLQTGQEAERYAPYLPNLLEAFIYDDGAEARQALVMEKYTGWYALLEVQNRYPVGIDPKDMAWIWRRLLVAIGFAHANRIIHGAVLPKNVWIEPEQHGLMLVNWFAAVVEPENSGETIPVIDPTYAAWYPEEVFKQALPVKGLDIVLAARCMVALLGGDPASGYLPVSIPAPLRSFFRGCLLPVKLAPQEAWALTAEFDELIERLWGPRQFHPFKMR